jgi:hypothetical protein
MLYALVLLAWFAGPSVASILLTGLGSMSGEHPLAAHAKAPTG